MADDLNTGEVSDETTSFEDADSHTSAHADRAPTPDEEKAAEAQTVDPKVAESYREANERGANVRGEGQIDGGS